MQSQAGMPPSLHRVTYPTTAVQISTNLFIQEQGISHKVITLMSRDGPTELNSQL